MRNPATTIVPAGEPSERSHATPRSEVALARLEAAKDPRRWNPWLDALIDRNVAALRESALMKNTGQRYF